jgi:hypothetical protein
MMASAMMQTSSGTGTVSDLAPGKHLLCLVTNLKRRKNFALLESRAFIHSRAFSCINKYTLGDEKSTLTNYTV